MPQHIHDVHDIGIISPDVASCDLPLLVKMYYYMLWTRMFIYGDTVNWQLIEQQEQMTKQ